MKFCSISYNTCRIFANDFPLTQNLKNYHRQCVWKELSSSHANQPYASKLMSDYYQPKLVEENRFLKQNLSVHQTQVCNDSTFSMILPPPNVTGSLHLGHALTLYIQDAIILWNQMNGKDCKWIPGCDHAGIATQVRVEQLLKKESGISRHQLSSEEFLSHIYAWKSSQERKIFEQLLTMGSCLDFDKSMFTLDEKMSTAVTKAFITLFNSKLIYKKLALVNWCFQLQSAISDIEVDHIKIDGMTEIFVPGYKKMIKFGLMYDISYRIENSDEEITIATTRPETILGDVAVAVNPKDKRYFKFHGKFVINPFNNLRMPIICDDAVNSDFGTGAVKITPGHDFLDYEISQRHNLKILNVFSDEDKISIEVEPFVGMKRYDCREKIVEVLSQNGLLKSVNPHSCTIPMCSRSGDVIEPILKPQWYLKCSHMAERAIECVESGELQLLPKHHEGAWFHWLKNIKDWCISRQLIWGHRIPVYNISHPGIKSDVTVVAESIDEAFMKAQKICDCAKENITINQETDVLDTWFSSALIPLVAFGWPDKKSIDFNKYYPLNLMETGYDILFFWVARMVMLGQELTGHLPFKKVLLHGIIVDKDDRKMSKSVGNVINPDDVIRGASIKELTERVDYGVKMGYMNLEQAKIAKTSLRLDYPKGIPECGSDGLRFLLLSSNTQQDKVRIKFKDISSSKKLPSKLWQIVRFTKNALDSYAPIQFDDLDSLHPSTMDRWMLHQTAQILIDVKQHFDTYELHQISQSIKEFWMEKLSNVYLECSKSSIYGNSDEGKVKLNILLTCIRLGLLVSTPILPFICNELNHQLPKCGVFGVEEDIRFAKLPSIQFWQKYINEDVNEQVQFILKVSKVIRDLRAKAHRCNHSVLLHTNDDNDRLILENLLSEIRILSKCKDIEIDKDNCHYDAQITLSSKIENVSLTLKIDEMSDEVKAVRIHELNKRKEKLIDKLEDIQDLMNSKKYLKINAVQKETTQENLYKFTCEVESISNLLKVLN